MFAIIILNIKLKAAEDLKLWIIRFTAQIGGSRRR